MKRVASIFVLPLLLSCSLEGRDPPNIILISMDTTRSDHCSVYGYERDTTPNLRRFAEQGARFDLAYSPTSTTGPTHASLFTSVYPMEHGLIKNGLPLLDRFITLSEHLREGGYETAGVVSSYVLHSKFGYGQGFDFYDDRIDPRTSKIRMDGQEEEDIEDGFDWPGDETTRRAIDWLDRERDPQGPFFLFLHYFDPHHPYAPPEPFLSRFAPRDEHPSPVDVSVGAYDGDLAFTDSQIGVFLEALEDRGLDENTIVVIVGDHGEGLMQHGFMRHGRQLYEESVRVPFLVRWPGRVEEGLVFSAPVELLDVAPTLFDLIGLDARGFELKGRSLAAALRGEERYEEENRPIFLFRRHYKDGGSKSARGVAYGLRAGEWKYIYGPDERREELFNLTSDPTESVNLAGAQREVADRLWRRLEDWRAANTRGHIVPATIDEADREALKALGYLE